MLLFMFTSYVSMITNHLSLVVYVISEVASSSLLLLITWALCCHWVVGVGSSHEWEDLEQEGFEGFNSS